MATNSTADQIAEPKIDRPNTGSVNDPFAVPRAEYEQRMESRKATAVQHDALSNRLSTFRGLIFLVGVAAVIIVGQYDNVSAWIIAVPIAIFAVLRTWHSRIVNNLNRAQSAADYYQNGLNRLDDKWAAVGPGGDRYIDPQHVYSGDLDLFGKGSLFQLISRARTRLGEDTLSSWLLAPADVATLTFRRKCVEELQSHLDLREKLALLDAEVHEDLNQNLLRAWAGEKPQPLSPLYRILGIVLPLIAIGALVAWSLGMARISWLIIACFPLGGFTFLFRKQLKDLSETVQSAGSGLSILSQVLELFENEKFTTPALQTLQEQLNAEGHRPSYHIKKLNGFIELLNHSLQNQFLMPIGFLLALPVHLIHRIETWRANAGPKIPEWLAAVGHFEAIVSIAGYTYEHPQDTFAELVDDGTPCFEAEQIGHPLLPVDQCVRNDVSLGQSQQLILISGSNMSGKSTLLRTVGTAVVLSLAGAPVRAKQLRISPLQLGTAMRIQDSLQDGKSLFFAVINRIKAVVEMAGQSLPLLFLLDEILQGTNSHDRRVGAEGIIRKLVKDGAIGFVTTHDLALTKIIDSFGDKAINCHFQDELLDGKMTFDYNIRPGIVEKSNALALMRMTGLDV